MTSAHNHALLHAVVEGTTDAVFVKDHQGCYLMINSAGARFLGKSVEEVLGKDDTELFTPETARSIMDTDRRIMATGETETLEDSGTAAGLTRTYLTTKSPYRDQDGHVVGVIGIARDITERKQAETGLQQLADIVQSSDDAIIGKTLGGIIVSWNRGAERIYGYTAAEVKGRSISLLVPSGRSDEPAEILAKVQRGMSIEHYETIRQRKDYKLIDVSLTISPIRDVTGAIVGVSTIARDITERKRAEEVLQKRLDELTILNRIGVICSEARDEDEVLRGATELIAGNLFPDNCGFVLLDRGILVPHPSFLIANREAANRADIRVDTGIIGQVARTGRPRRVGDVSQEPAYWAADPSTRSELCIPVIVGSKVVGVVNVESRTLNAFSAADEQLVTTIAGLVGNALDRLRTAQALRQSEERLNLAVHAADLGIFEHDHQTDTVYWSPMMRALFGWGAEEAASLQAYFALIHPEDRERIVAAVQQAHAPRGDGLYRAEHRLVRPDAGMRWVSVSSRTLFEGERDARRPLRTVGIVADISERKRAEQEIREYSGSVQALSRQLLTVQEEERRHLARELHDEIGQLLTGLRLSLKTGDLPSDASKASFERARAMVDELLAKVRDLSFDLRPAALDQLGLLPALLALFERFTQQTGVLVSFKHKDVERRFAPEVETTAYRVVQEGLTNVARHAGVGGVTVRVWASADMLDLQIEDRGRGFEPAAVFAGAGSTGLTGMRERITLLHGHLTIESDPGGGTQITAELPLGDPSERKIP